MGRSLRGAVRLAGVLEKVTSFVTRGEGASMEVLLFRHPNAGVQVPAGTVDEGEEPLAAALREASEETGLAGLRVLRGLGILEQDMPAGRALVLREPTVYSRPDPGSFDWAHFRRGIEVAVERQEGDFVHATYREWDNSERPDYITFQVTGWVQASSLCSRSRRYFYHLAFEGGTPPEWDVSTDNHIFRLFWAPVARLPRIAPPQDEWLAYAPWEKSSS